MLVGRQPRRRGDGELAGLLSLAVARRRARRRLLSVYPELPGHRRRVGACSAGRRRVGRRSAACRSCASRPPTTTSRCSTSTSATASSIYEVAVGEVADRFGSATPGFSGIPVRDEIRLRRAVCVAAERPYLTKGDAHDPHAPLHRALAARRRARSRRCSLAGCAQRSAAAETTDEPADDGAGRGQDRHAAHRGLAAAVGRRAEGLLRRRRASTTSRSSSFQSRAGARRGVRVGRDRRLHGRHHRRRQPRGRRHAGHASRPIMLGADPSQGRFGIVVAPKSERSRR